MPGNPGETGDTVGNARATGDRDAFLRAICAAPEDDTPRLVFADYLEEQGEPERAEFIRLQCELARLVAAGHVTHLADRKHCSRQFTREGCEECGRSVDLARRERGLLKAHFGAWTDHVPDSLVTKQCPSCVDQGPDYETGVVECRRCDSTGLVPDEEKVEFRRGFVAEVHATLAVLLPPCERCDGYGRVRYYRPDVIEFVDDCQECDSTGRGPSPLAELIGVEPLEAVVALGRAPADRTAVNGRWYWFRQERNALGEWRDENHLPGFLFDLLPDATGDTIGLPYPTRGEAMAALSRVVLTLAAGWGRHQPLADPGGA